MRTTLACLVAIATAFACTVDTTDNFQNPPPPPPSTCAVDTAVAGCTAGSVGYACTSDRPDDGDTNLVCSAGSHGAGGTTLYCCLPYAQYFTECTPDTTIPGCADPAFGFLCVGQTTPGVDAGPTTPANADSNLACSTAIPSGSGLAYCCVSSEVNPTCAADPAFTCAGASVGFSCTGNDSPGEGDAPVACSVGTSGEAGSTSRCCLPFAQSPMGCEENQQVQGCEPGAYGFTCAGLHEPQEWNASLTCTALAGSTFCCTTE
jgi:hypothetical protein